MRTKHQTGYLSNTSSHWLLAPIPPTNFATVPLYLPSSPCYFPSFFLSLFTSVKKASSSVFSFIHFHKSSQTKLFTDIMIFCEFLYSFATVIYATPSLSVCKYWACIHIMFDMYIHGLKLTLLHSPVVSTKLTGLGNTLVESSCVLVQSFNRLKNEAYLGWYLKTHLFILPKFPFRLIICWWTLHCTWTMRLPNPYTSYITELDSFLRILGL